MVAMRAVVNSLGLVSTVVIARLLTPDDFGIVALAGSAYAFLALLGQFGFDSALIHKRSPDRSHYDTAWTANILVGVAVGMLTFAIAKPAALFFEDPRIEYVVYAFSVLSFAKGLENVGVVNFRKDLKFRGDFLYFVLPKVVSISVAIAAAFVLRNYWALVIGMITSQLVTLLYSHFSQPFRPRPSLSRFGELFNYSKWIIATNFIKYMSTNGLDIVLGKLLGTSAVGAYGVAKQIAFLPSEELLAPINRALFPGFSTVSDDPPRVRNILARVLGVTGLIAIPAAAGIIVLSETLTLVVLGPKWLMVSDILGVLGFAGLVMAMRGALGPVLMARGLPKVLTVANTALLVVILPATIYLVPRIGVVGVAWATVAGGIVTTPILLHAVRRDIGFGWGMVIARVWRPTLASGLMAAAVVWVDQALADQSMSGPLHLLLGVSAGVVAYPIILLGIWLAAGRPAGAESELLQLFRGRIRRPGVAPNPG